MSDRVPAMSSDLQTASAQVTASMAVLHVVTLNPGSAASTLIVYDSEDSSTSGKRVLAKLVAAANTASVTETLAHGTEALRGIYCAVSGTGAEYVIKFHKVR